MTHVLAAGRSRRATRVLRPLAVGALALAGLTCRDRGLTGPGIPQRAHLALAAAFAGPADAPVVRLERLRVVARRLGAVGTVRDLVVPFPAASDEVAVVLDLDVAGPSEPFQIVVSGIAGTDTVYRGIDTVTVVARDSVPARAVTMRYAGADTVIAALAIAPRDTTVSNGDAFRLRVTATQAGGAAVTGARVRFVSRDPARLEMADDGRGTAKDVFAGVWVVATSGNGTQDSTRVVSQERVATIALAPDSSDLTRGDAVRLTATLRDRNGAVLTGRTIAWASSRPAALSIDGTGLATGLLADSTVTITATSEGKVATARVRVVRRPVASVTVTPSPATVVVGNAVTLAAQPRDAAGAANDDWPVSFLSLDETVVRLAPIAGAPKSVSAAGLAVGGTTVRASAGGRSVDVTVTVTPPAANPVDRVVVTPAAPSILPGEGVALAASALDVGGAAVDGIAFAWTTSNAAVATVSATGVVTGVAPGTATVTATGGGKSGTATVTVRPPAAVVRRVDAGPDRALAAIGATVALAPAAFDAADAPLPGVPFTYAALDPAIATVSGAGVVTAVANGSARVVAASGAAADTVVVTVLQRVASLTVAPDTLLLAVNASGALTATALDARGVPVPSSVQPVAWTSRDPSRVTVTATGVATVKAGAYAIVVATADGQSDSSVVVKTPPDVPVGTRLGRIDLTPASATLRVGDTLTFRAEFVDAAGVRTVIAPAWGSTHLGRLALSSLGLATALDTGAAQATATKDAVVGRAVVTVLPAPVPTLLDLLPGALAGSATAPVTATARVDAYDQGTGITAATITLASPSGAQTASCTASAPTTGTVRGGSWRCAVTLPQGSETGMWRVTAVQLAGTVARTFGPSALAARGLGATVTVSP